MFSSFSRHIKHLFAKARPLFQTISKVKALPHVASHAKKLILGCTFTFQIQLEGNKDEPPASRTTQRDLTENLPLLVSIQDTISSTASITLLPCSLSKNLSASSTSQSLNALKKQGFQPPQPPSAKGSQICATHASLSTVKAKRERKNIHRGESPHHLSLQKLTLLPYRSNFQGLYII